MNSATTFTMAIIAVIILIITSLGYGLFNLLTSSQSNDKIAKALSYRISLSLFLFVSVLFAIYQGWVIPNPPLL